MKTYQKLFFCAPCLLLAVSCAKEWATPAGESKPLVISAVADNDGTRTSITDLSNRELTVLWEDDDRIGIFTSDGTVFQSDEAPVLSEDSREASFTFSDLEEGATLSYAIYPYDAKASCTSSGISLSKGIPTIQKAVSGSFASGANVAVADASDAGKIQFRNVGAVLGISFSSDKEIYSITLETDGGSLTGSATIGVSSENFAAATVSGGSGTVMLSNVGATSGTYGVVVYPGSYSGLNVTFTATDGYTATYTTSSTLEIGRNKYLFIRDFDDLDDRWTASEKGIRSVLELEAFRDDVNSGADLSAWENDEGYVTLLADLDMSTVTDWTPIGDASYSLSTSVKFAINEDTHHAFYGKFDGAEHTITNFAQSYTELEGGRVHGLFGVLADGAEVKDLTFGSGCSLTVSASDFGAFGVLAGLAQGAAISGIISRSTISGGGSTSLHSNTSGGFAAGVCVGIIGLVLTGSTATTVSNVVNYGSLTGVSGKITTSNAVGVSFGGICGLVTTSSTKTATFTSCVNYGEISGTAGRSAGIVATCNRYTSLVSCTNEGDIHNSYTSAEAILGGISAIAGAGSTFKSCINKGQVVSEISKSSGYSAGRVGGIIGSFNAVVTVSDCENYGTSISNSSKRGTLFGQCINATTFSKCVAGGRVGTYSDGTWSMTEINGTDSSDSGYYLNSSIIGYYDNRATNVTNNNISYSSTYSE